MPNVLRTGSRSRRPRLPEGVRIYAISDIHGCADLLRQMLVVIDRDIACSRPMRVIHVFLGDYIDRGPRSMETIDLLVDRARRHESVFLKGNHEAFMFEVLREPALLREWKRVGGLETMVSYGLRPPLNPDDTEQLAVIGQFERAIPPSQRSFFDNLQSHFECGDFFFVHAGIKPGVPLETQNEKDLLWIRDEFLQSEAKFPKYIVHGHTPVRQPDIRPNRINIDTGAYATGNLTLLTIQGDSIIAL